MSKKTISILVPAYNEEKMIVSCIKSCLAQTRKPDQIVVVNDGSTDRTGEILKEFGNQITVVTVEQPTGNKSRAQEIGLQSVTSDIFVATDGDTILDSHFLEQVEKDFIKDPDLAAVAGYVRSTSFNYLTAIREIDYVLGQDLYKYAQSCVHFLFVIPGCAGAFKTTLFKDGIVHFDHDTLTEDLDFTYKIHLLGLRIKFNLNAIVYTQDPHTLPSYINQMRRWYAGGWQNLRKHFRIMLSRPSAALQLSLNYLEGTIFSILLFSVLFVNAYIFINVLLIYLVVSLGIGAYAAARRGRLDLLLYSPLGIFIRVLHAYLFLEQGFCEIVLRKRKMDWFHPERRIVFKQ